MPLYLGIDIGTSGTRAILIDHKGKLHGAGTASQEMFSVDRTVIEPLPWPGNPNKTIDETNLGKYLFEVRDRVGIAVAVEVQLTRFEFDHLPHDPALDVSRSDVPGSVCPAQSGRVSARGWALSGRFQRSEATRRA